MIDKMLAEERTVTSDDREARLGPTLNSNFKRGLSASTHSNDFHLLLPDVTSASTVQCATSGSGSEESTPRNDATAQLAVDMLRPKSRSTPRNPKQTAALLPEGLSDTEFMEYYKQLTPSDRKKQLNVQKQALVDEQERLKRLLRQQEELLERKHAELQRQQVLQSERLLQFENETSKPVLAPEAANPNFQQLPQPIPNQSHQYENMQYFNPMTFQPSLQYNTAPHVSHHPAAMYPTMQPQQHFAIPSFKELPPTMLAQHSAPLSGQPQSTQDAHRFYDEMHRNTVNGDTGALYRILHYLSPCGF